MRKQTSSRTAPAAPQAPATPPPQAISYIAGVVGVAVLASVLAFVQNPTTGIQVVFIWTLAALAGELMTFPTATRRAHINLATTVHMAMILVLPLNEILAVMWLSRSVAKLIVHRQVWYRALFNVSQASLAVLAAAMTYQTLGGTLGIEFTLPGLVQVGPEFLAAALVYYVLNTSTVAGVVALTTRDTIFRAWRENYGYLAEIASTAALVLLAPIASLCYLNLNWIGLTVFLFPMLFIRASSVRYISLRQAQQSLIASERLAAKGEIAAEVGHEINNYLAGVYGQLQLLMLKEGKLESGAVEKRLSSVMTQLDSISTLSKGLVNFTQKESRFTLTPLAQLVENTVAFLQPQNRFDGVIFDLDLDSRVDQVNVDAGQIQQAIMNLLINAANAMVEAECEERHISVWVRLHDVSGQVEIGVADSGPGVPEASRLRIFEPGFTTRTEGHGFGLSTTHRVVLNHGGTITVEDNPSGGALFRISLPLREKKAA